MPPEALLSVRLSVFFEALEDCFEEVSDELSVVFFVADEDASVPASWDELPFESLILSCAFQPLDGPGAAIFAFPKIV